jgi:hypothetical protein
MKVHLKTILSVILFITTCSAIAETPPEGPYFGLTPPGKTPEVFAPGIISLPNRFEQDICFSEDGGECYFSVRNSAWTEHQIYETHYENGEWTTPVQASFSNNHSTAPALADNDQSLYFSRDADIWKVVRTEGGWSAPVMVPAPVNSTEDEWSCRISNLGNAWICSWRPGGSGACDIWRVQYADGNFINPTNISSINTTYSDCQPVAGPDEKYVIFNPYSLPGGFGNGDLYISLADGQGGWKSPQNLGPTINTSRHDICPYISPDNKYLFFSRQVSSTDANIYWVDICALFPAYDFSCDGRVDFEDMEILAAHWLTNEPSIDIIPPEAPDGIVNFREFTFLAHSWRRTNFTAPLAPTGLQSTSGNSTASLDWNNNSEDNLTGYNLYRSTTFGSGYARLNVSLLSNSDYTDNNVVNGTIYYYVVTAVNTYSDESAYSSQVSAIPLDPGNIIIQENTTGFCDVNGVIDSQYANYTGSGYAKTSMSVGSGINWRVNVPSSGTYTLKWRHSHGAGTRNAKLLINSVEVSTISFPATGGGSIWSYLSIDVSLTAGINNIRLKSAPGNYSGLPLIDYMMVTGDNPQPASCP